MSGASNRWPRMAPLYDTEAGEPEQPEFNRIMAIGLTELLLDLLRHDGSDQTRQRVADLSEMAAEAEPFDRQSAL